MWPFINNLSIAIIVAVVSSFLTVVLAFRRFKSERWWERKVDAYTAIIESLHVMKKGIERDLRDWNNHQPPSDDKSAVERYQKAREELDKSVDMSAFLLSAETQQRLHTLMAEMRSAYTDTEFAPGHADFFSAMTVQLEVLDKCLKDIPVIAKRDLRLS